MFNTPKISVIVPVYNCEKYLETCFKSLILQTYTNLEIICINDGSPDNSQQILDAYAQKDSRIKLLNGPNGGVSKARNRGLEIATGDYVSFIDSDDWILLDLYKKFTKVLEKLQRDIDIWVFNVGSYMEGQDDILPRTFFNIQDWSNHKDEYTIHTFNDCMRPFSGNLSAANRIYRREFLVENNIQFPENLIFEDTYFSLKSFLHASSIVLSDEIMYRYRNYQNGSIMSSVSEKTFNIFDIIDLIEKEIINLNLYEDYKYALFQFKYTSYAQHYTKTPSTLRQKYYEQMKTRLLQAEKQNLDIKIYSKLKNYDLFEFIKNSTFEQVENLLSR